MTIFLCVCVFTKENILCRVYLERRELVTIGLIVLHFAMFYVYACMSVCASSIANFFISIYASLRFCSTFRYEPISMLLIHKFRIDNRRTINIFCFNNEYVRFMDQDYGIHWIKLIKKRTDKTNNWRTICSNDKEIALNRLIFVFFRADCKTTNKTLILNWKWTKKLK